MPSDARSSTLQSDSSSILKNPEKKYLRKILRSRRNKLSVNQQIQAATRIAELVSELEVFQQAKTVAAYRANDGEISPHKILELAELENKLCFLPRVEQSEMQFFRYQEGDTLVKNRFGIDEPEAESEKINARSLDLVLLPLVGYDASGRRLGMGGGYYDRCYAFKRDATTHTKPVLLGLAHRCQEVDELPVEYWDIPLNMIVDDQKVLSW